jgi:hypothetical protein
MLAGERALARVHCTDTGGRCSQGVRSVVEDPDDVELAATPFDELRVTSRVRRTGRSMQAEIG